MKPILLLALSGLCGCGDVFGPSYRTFEVTACRSDANAVYITPKQSDGSVTVCTFLKAPGCEVLNPGSAWTVEVEDVGSPGLIWRTGKKK